MLYTTIARILFAIPFVVFGLLHFLFAGAMASIVPVWLPGGIIWVFITGLCLLAAGISIIIEQHAALACKLLAVLLFIFVATVHLPGLLEAGSMNASLAAMLKDIGLIGGALTYAGIFDST